MADEKCKIMSGDTWYRHPCGRPVVGTLQDGTPACGVHIGADTRRAKREQATEERAKALAEIKAARLRNSIQDGMRTLGIRVVARKLSDVSEVFDLHVPGAVIACNSERAAYRLAQNIITEAVEISPTGADDTDLRSELRERNEEIAKLRGMLLDVAGEA